jgi:hypothetical protein
VTCQALVLIFIFSINSDIDIFKGVESVVTCQTLVLITEYSIAFTCGYSVSVGDLDKVDGAERSVTHIHNSLGLRFSPQSGWIT